MEQNPALMARQLKENAQKIASLTEQVIDARNALLLADADYMDAQAEAYQERSLTQSATAAEKWSKIDTIKQWKHREEAKTYLQNLQDRLRVLEMDNNNLKMAIKLVDLEVKNLSL
jgi:hypothetical protein